MCRGNSMFIVRIFCILNIVFFTLFFTCSLHAAAPASDAALADLVAKDALTVRALIAFDKIPAQLMAPLNGLRGRGVDVLGASPGQIDALLQKESLNAAEKDALTQISRIMHATMQPSGRPEPKPQPGTAQQREDQTPAFIPLPPMPLPPALPMVELGSAQYVGLITTAKEATRILMGEMSEAETQAFEKHWAPYYDYPSPEIIEYFRTATPIISEFLNIRQAIATTSEAFDQAWEEAQIAAQYENEAHTDAALAQANMLKDYLVSLEARGNQLAQALQALGEAPDPAAARKKARARHESARKSVEEVFTATPSVKGPLEGIWYGSKDDDPLIFVVYTVGGDPGKLRYRALCLHPTEYLTSTYITTFGMNDGDTNMPGVGHFFTEDSLRHTIRKEIAGISGGIIRVDETTFSADRLADDAESFGYPPPVNLEAVEAAFHKEREEREQKRANLEARFKSLGHKNPEAHSKEGAERLAMVAALQVMDKEEEAGGVWASRCSYVESVRRYHELTPTFVYAARQWLKERPFSDKTTLDRDEEIFEKIFSLLIPEQETQVATQAPATAETADTGNATAREAALKEAKEKLESIAFHRQNMEIISRNLERDQAELARETDPERRAQLRFRVICGQSDLQVERDHIASIETGTIVYNRTPFDDYARAAMIVSIQENQRRTKAFQRSSQSLFKLAAMLPGSEGEHARAFVERQLTREVRANMDQEAVKRIANALGKKVQGHYESLAAKSEEDAAWANLGLETAENMKLAADGSMMVASLFGGQAINRVYLATTGYIEGGATGAVLKTARSFGPTAGAAAEALRGYQEGGVKTAVTRGAVYFATAKSLEYGAKKILAWKAGRANAQTTAKEAMEFGQARQQGETLVRDFQKAQRELAEAGARGASAKEILNLQNAVRHKTTAINANMHAKNFLKYKGAPQAQKAYNAHLRAVHAEVEAGFHSNMSKMGWNKQPLREFRNAASGDSVGMDFDIGLDEKLAKNLTRHGERANLVQWQQDAQKAWDQAYKASTGHSATQSWETVTTSVHPESYSDLAWLSHDKSGLKKALGQQGADVSRYKAWHMQNDSSLSRMEKWQEISRGAAKDIKTKLNPVLDKFTPSKEGAKHFRELREHWNDVQQVLDGFGRNDIDPVTASRRIRELTGGKDIPQVVEDMGYLLESTVQAGSFSN